MLGGTTKAAGLPVGSRARLGVTKAAAAVAKVDGGRSVMMAAVVVVEACESADCSVVNGTMAKEERWLKGLCCCTENAEAVLLLLANMVMSTETAQVVAPNGSAAVESEDRDLNVLILLAS